ncbi:oxygenase-related, partial [Schistosoma mansoni]|uniref:oxygenase-related n=1 Tax=Schistosoma mansoni TaxID=6183 RepID=UPI0001A61D8F
FCVRVLLDRRSLVVVSGPARYIWQHEIRRTDITTRRIAMTFRELSSTFSPASDNMTDEQRFGQKLLEIASTYAHM